MLASEAQILEVLRRQNTWWQTGQIPEDFAPPTRRLAFFEIQSLLSEPDLKRAIILSGARRVGKTVLLHQIAQESRAKGLDSRKILYVTFEDPTLTQANLREIIGLYEKNVAAIGEGTLILLDELHYTANWARWLMTILREYPRTRVIATGSAAVLLREAERTESAAGRWVSIHVPTLSFFEYVQFRGGKIPILPPGLTPGALTKSDARTREAILAACSDLQLEFNRYLLQGGFPAVVNLSLALAQRLIREDVVDKVLKRDMAHLYGARSLGELDQIFVYLCFNSGGIVEKNTLAKELGVAAATVENHLRRLEDAHLIYRLPPYSLEGKKALKPRPKIYIADSALRNAVILRGESLFENETELGTVIEGCVMQHIYAFYYPQRPHFGYWRDSRTDREVDFVMMYPNGTRIAFEAKYREHPALSPKEGLVELMKSSKAPERAYLITKNTTDFGPTSDARIFQIPAFLFTFLLGHSELHRWLKSK